MATGTDSSFEIEEEYSSSARSDISDYDDFDSNDIESLPDSLIERAGITLTRNPSKHKEHGKRTSTHNEDNTRKKKKTSYTSSNGLHEKEQRRTMPQHCSPRIRTPPNPIPVHHSTPKSKSKHTSNASSQHHSSHDFHSPRSQLSSGMSIEDKLDIIISELKQVKRTQNEMLEMWQRERSASTKKQKLDVPNYVRVAVRDAYKSGIEDEHGHEWRFSTINSQQKLKYNSTCNEAMTNYIQSFVLGIYAHVAVGVIRAAIERYFISMKESNQRSSTGKHDTHKKKMAGLERRRRKMKRRQAALKKKTSYAEDTKKRLASVLTIDFMSSEDEEESEGEEFFVVKKLPWRSAEATEYFKELDKKGSETSTSRGNRQRVRRVRSQTVSKRSVPDVSDDLLWAVDQSA